MTLAHRRGPLAALLAATALAACKPTPATTAATPAARTARVFDATPRLIPQPETLHIIGGAPFTLDSTVTIVTDGSDAAGRIGDALAAILRPSTELPVAVHRGGAMAGKSIRLRLGGRADLGAEGYEMIVTGDSVAITAAQPAGLFHGTQTLRQLFPPAIESDIGFGHKAMAATAVHVIDRPRYAWRGGMLDVARHFFTVDEVEQYIDLLALYKMNVLHLHLTDDQGWRIQIDSRPKLTAVGAVSEVGGRRGGFYTKQDFAEIVRYAGDRYITVVPELEMPSHINAAMTAYPEISCSVRNPGTYTGTDVGWSAVCVDKDSTYAFVDDVIRELAAMTPGPYIHIGGDEVASLTRDQYVKFVERAQDIVSKYGKTMIGWEEITKARMKPTTLAQQWKSDSAANGVRQGIKLIMSPSDRIYLDMKYDANTELGLDWAAQIELQRAYDWDPATYMPGVTDANIVGVEGPLWSETVRNIGAAEYLLMPRLPAVAEIGWTPQSVRDWSSFRDRIAAHAPRWNYLGVNYYRTPQVSW